jgi:hypothetical protein
MVVSDDEIAQMRNFSLLKLVFPVSTGSCDPSSSFTCVHFLFVQLVQITSIIHQELH